MPDPFRLFVYGTLKCGFPARERFLSGTSVTEAVVSGTIYALSAGYPAIVIPAEGKMAVGSSNLRADLRRQGEGIHGELKLPDGPLVYGEIVEVDDIETVREIDDYEGFDPSDPEDGLYTRVLVTARNLDQPDRFLPVWTYAMDAAEGIHLPDGRWDGP